MLTQSRDPPANQRIFSTTALGLLLPIAGAYATLAWLIVHYFYYVSPIWPSAAVAVAAVMLYGRSAVAGIFLGSFMANGIFLHWPLLGATIASLGNALSPLAGAWLYRLHAAHRPIEQADYFDSPRSVALYIFHFSLLASLFSSLMGLFGVLTFHAMSVNRLFMSLYNWLIADISSTVMLAPSLYLWGVWLQSRRRDNPSSGQQFNITLIALTNIISALALFWTPATGSVVQIGAMSLVVLPLILAAQRLNPRIALTLFAALYVIALSGTLLHRGPFGLFPLPEAISSLELMGSSVGIAVLIASVLDLQRRKAVGRLQEMNDSLELQIMRRTDELARSELRSRQILEISPLAMILIEPETQKILFINDEFLRLFHIPSERANDIDFDTLWAEVTDAHWIASHLLAGGTVHNHEMPFRDLSEGMLWLSISAVLTIIDDKQALMYVFKDISQLKTREAELLTQATTDALTGLYNRRQTRELTRRWVQAAAPETSTLSICLFDLDHFKKINDSFGHHCGDNVLRHVATAARNCIREQDILGRWGGEEFILILPDTPADRALILIERLRYQLTQTVVVCDNGKLISFSASFGLVEVSDSGSDSTADPFDEWVKDADFALYRAKQNGRNRVEM